MGILKLLSLVALFKDVTAEVQKAGVEKRPWYLQRSVFGAVVALASGAAAAYLGVTFDEQTLSGITDNVTQLATVLAALYGTALSVYGMVRKAVKTKGSEQ